MTRSIHTADARHFKKLWLAQGGKIVALRNTGEVRYIHTYFIDTVRANNRRKDVPAVLLSRLNQLLRASAANGRVVH